MWLSSNVDLAHGAVSRLRLALSFKQPSTVRVRERNDTARAKETADRAPSEPSGSLAETGPFSFLVIIEIGSQVLLLSRGAPLAVITRCNAGLRTRTALSSLRRSAPPLWNGYYRVPLTPMDIVIKNVVITNVKTIVLSISAIATDFY
ncbi:unnamed protein product [Colias eurytheme]|nr:unnamed protein product [Colias eurytheme]